MSEKHKTEMPSPDKLVFQQSENTYNSIPSVEDVMKEMGIKNTENEEVFRYKQTLGGIYSSMPTAEDVLYELGIDDEEENDWWQEAMNSGHGEYVDNVEAAVKYCKLKGVTTREEVEEMLEKAEPLTSYAEYAIKRGHGEYVDNVKKAAEYCKAKGAETKEAIEEILNNAEIES